MATKKQVAKAWQSGHVATTPNGSFSTDGETLWSYQLKIGYTLKEWVGEHTIFARFITKIVLDYTSPTGNFKSSTTSTHVGLAKQYADKVEVPA